MPVTRLSVLVLVLLAAGCATRGEYVDPDEIDEPQRSMMLPIGIAALDRGARKTAGVNRGLHFPPVSSLPYHRLQ